MTDILQDFADAKLTAANKANLFAYYDYLGRSTSPIVDYHDGPEFKWFVTGLAHFFFNQVFSARLAADHVGERVDELLANFEGKGVRHLLWWHERGAQPAGLDERLEAHGFTYADHGLDMAIDLQQLDDRVASVPGLTIERVTGAGALRVWMDTALPPFGMSLADSAACCEVYQDRGFDLPFRYYLGRWNGRPVATSQLFLGEGVAGIYCVATAEDARRRGIGAAMTMAPLLEARDLGYRVGILQATAMGAPVYRRMGFREHSSSGFYYKVP